MSCCSLPTSSSGISEAAVPSLDSAARGKSFPTTRWTALDLAKQGSQRSLDDFYRRYATAVYCYFRAKRLDPETAKDLTQDLFVKLSNGRLLRHLQPRRYRFRSYLIRAAKNQWIDYLKKKRCELKHRIGPLDEVLASVGHKLEPRGQVTAEQAYDRQAAQSLLDEALRKVQLECRVDGLSTHWAIFESRYLSLTSRRWKHVGQDHDVSSQKASNMARTVEVRFRRVLRQLVELECRDANEVKQELRRLIGVFSQPLASLSPKNE